METQVGRCASPGEPLAHIHKKCPGGYTSKEVIEKCLRVKEGQNVVNKFKVCKVKTQTHTVYCGIRTMAQIAMRCLYCGVHYLSTDW